MAPIILNLYMASGEPTEFKASQVGFHSLHSALRDEVFCREITEAWDPVRVVPGPGLLERAGPVYNLVNDLPLSLAEGPRQSVRGGILHVGSRVADPTSLSLSLRLLIAGRMSASSISP